MNDVKIMKMRGTRKMADSAISTAWSATASRNCRRRSSFGTGLRGIVDSASVVPIPITALSLVELTL